MRVRVRALFAWLAFLMLATAAPAGDWPLWRGPRGDGISGETNLPVRWSRTDNIAWKTPIPGKGHSSPIVWSDRIFVTTCTEEDQKRLLLCLNCHNGKIVWQSVVLTARLEGINRLNSRASSTPATDGRHVWVTFLDDPNVIVACYDFEGHQVWKRSPGTFSSRHGFCSSVVPYRDTIIVNVDQDGNGYLVALDGATGATRWQTARPNNTRSYCAPILIEAAGRQQLVLSGSKCVASYNPDDGKLWWIIDGPTEQYVSSLVFGNDLLFLTAGFPTYHYLAIRPNGSGNVTHTNILWHLRPPTREGDYVPSPIAHGRWFFAVSDNGWASCYEAQTGKRMWLQRLGRHHSASPVCAEGRLYFTADNGETFVLTASGLFDLISSNPLGEECYASPAISYGHIFLRAAHHLYCIGKGTSQEK
jgi:outer membrane protein assembly factor BamB